jgi:hypothetical protein
MRVRAAGCLARVPDAYRPAAWPNFTPRPICALRSVPCFNAGFGDERTTDSSLRCAGAGAPQRRNGTPSIPVPAPLQVSNQPLSSPDQIRSEETEKNKTSFPSPSRQDPDDDSTQQDNTD